jgi:glucosamine 6-phosphate synthetase-like amidotransferase/phosphosugar isomerase protein
MVKSMSVKNLAQSLWRGFCNLPLPLPGLRMGLACGVLGLVYARRTVRLGDVATRLLRVLEYRGYDSTGGVFQDGERITLLKAPGAPSEICAALGMPSQEGTVFCGQVRWATFGAVDELNAQPHVMSCKRPIYGAHNGNISNSPQLKEWLLERGHRILSDNDGEMLVHLIEDHFDSELGKGVHESPEAAMRAAIVAAARQVEGAYAAVVVLPETGTSWAIKAGSSLYAGLGVEEDEGPNPFFLASSDLTAVLGRTRMILPLRRGQFVEYKADKYQVYAFEEMDWDDPARGRIVLMPGDAVEVAPRFSRLRVDDIGLREGYRWYMEQEIADEVDSARRLVRYLSNGSPRLQLFRQTGTAGRRVMSTVEERLIELTDAPSPEALLEACQRLFENDALWELFSELPARLRTDFTFYSDAGPHLAWALERFPEHARRALLLLADLYHENDEINELTTQLYRFVEEARRSLEHGGQIYAVCSGTSYNAARTGAMFFNDLCGVKFVPLLPGEYRSQYNHSITAQDLLVTISQSGETKDVIDVVDDLRRKAPQLKHICVVNNMNSTLAQEKADVAIPLRCGPEIAVPATKSFINQLTMLYGMALYLAAARGGRERGSATGFEAILGRRERLEQIPDLLARTLKETEASVELAADVLYQAPSLHILATRMWGVAREGALKIREVVLNHAEGIEATEFKHGPNTILGLNTGFGLDQVKDYTRALGAELARQLESGAMPEEEGALAQWLESLAERLFPEASQGEGQACPAALSSSAHNQDGQGVFDSLYRDYPLIYVTGPGKRDVELTITQINTHKIRGAMSIVIAEDDENLRRAALEPPMGMRDYKGIFIPLPPSGDLITTTFTSILVLQRLALRMCERKMALLDRLGVKDHGVHPDAPKNVSKSITVD